MDLIERAVEILQSGGLVAFPTETVYGLGADATSAAAVSRIFAAKGRPSTNPLIVHVADAHVAQRYAAAWPEAARELARRFWPGPLTLVLPKTAQIPAIVTAGLNTVALRVPNHPLALELLRKFDAPVAAPSANRSMQVSPTTAQHVHDELGEAVDLILDGGPCVVGIESTVLDLTSLMSPTTAPPTILRPGGVSREQIESLIGPVRIFQGSVDPKTAAASPGQHRRHYAPRTPAYRFEAEERERFMQHVAGQAGEVILLVIAGFKTTIRKRRGAEVSAVAMPPSPVAYARNLYAALRQADRTGPSAIYVEMPPDRPEWHAVRDRLSRATQPLP